MTKLELAQQIVEALQWHHTRQAAQSRSRYRVMPGIVYEACPMCGGVRPSDFAMSEWDLRDIGHGFDCPIGRFLEE